MATKQKYGTSQPSRGRKAPKQSASKSTSRSATKKEAGAPKRAQPKADGRLPICDEVPGCSGEVPLLRRIAHSGTFDLGRIAVAFDNAGPLRISLSG